MPTRMYHTVLWSYFYLVGWNSRFSVQNLVMSKLNRIIMCISHMCLIIALVTCETGHGLIFRTQVAISYMILFALTISVVMAGPCSCEPE